MIRITIRPLSNEGGGGFLAVVPDLPGGIADAGTPDGALANAHDAIGCWMEAVGGMDRTVPMSRQAAA